MASCCRTGKCCFCLPTQAPVNFIIMFKARKGVNGFFAIIGDFCIALFLSPRYSVNVN